MTVGIAYLDGPRLARSLYAASDWVAAGREEINRINVFPVPDGDTGTNFSMALRTVAGAVAAFLSSGQSGTFQPSESAIRDQSGTHLTMERFDNLLTSGRVSRGKTRIGGMLNVKPILRLDQSGRVVALGNVRGQPAGGTT